MAGKELVVWTADDTEFAMTATGDKASVPVSELARDEMRQGSSC